MAISVDGSGKRKGGDWALGEVPVEVSRGRRWESAGKGVGVWSRMKDAADNGERRRQSFLS